MACATCGMRDPLWAPESLRPETPLPPPDAACSTAPAAAFWCNWTRTSNASPADQPFRAVCRLQPGETWTGEMVIRSFDSMWERPLFEFDKTEEHEVCKYDFWPVSWHHGHEGDRYMSTELDTLNSEAPLLHAFSARHLRRRTRRSPQLRRRRLLPRSHSHALVSLRPTPDRHRLFDGQRAACFWDSSGCVRLVWWVVWTRA